MPTLFHEPWWLDIATGGRYDVAEVIDGGQVVGRLPYYIQKKLCGLSAVDLPPLTHFLGPAIANCYGKPNTQFLRRLDITNQLIGKLPYTSAFYMKCHRDVTDVIAFQGAGFRAAFNLRLRCILSLLRSCGRPCATRRAILSARHAENIALAQETIPIILCASMWAASKRIKARTTIWTSIYTPGLFAPCLERGRGKIYEARERNGRLVAAIFCAWDNVASYYLLTSRAHAAHGSSTSLLVWEAITDAIERNLIFDFDGIVSEGGARAASKFCPHPFAALHGNARIPFDEDYPRRQIGY